MTQRLRRFRPGMTTPPVATEGLIGAESYDIASANGLVRMTVRLGMTKDPDREGGGGDAEVREAFADLAGKLHGFANGLRLAGLDGRCITCGRSICGSHDEAEEHGAKYPTAREVSAYHDGHAAGYAEAVADIRRMVETLHSGATNVAAQAMFWAGGAGVQSFARALSQVIGMLERGAHVGAAKKP